MFQVKFGSPTATLLALCGLDKQDFTSAATQYALENSDAIDVLINVLELEVDDYRCKVNFLADRRDNPVNVTRQ